MGGASLLQKLLRDGEGSVIDDRLVVVLEYDVLCRIELHILTIYLFALVFVLSERSDIEVVAEYLRDGDDAPRFLHLALIFVTLRFLTRLFSHTGRWDMLVGQMVCNSFIAPSVDIEREYLSDDFGRRLVHLEQHFL